MAVSTILQNRNGLGRRKGSTNENTEEIRNMFRMFVTKAFPHVLENWEMMFKRAPIQATRVLIDAADFVIPRLARTEITGKDGKDLFPQPIIDILPSRNIINQLPDGSHNVQT